MTPRTTDPSGAEWPATDTTCGVCGWPTDPVLAGGPHPDCEDDADDALLAQPGVMRAVTSLGCRGCDGWIEPRQIMGLRDLPTGRAWVCRGCLVGPDTLPEPREAVSGDLRAPRGPVPAVPGGAS